VTGRPIEVTATTDVAASAGAVWRVLTELESYRDWNPFIRRASGSLEVGGTVHVRVRPSIPIPLAFSATVVSRDEGRELHWFGCVGGAAWLASGEHWFRVEPIDDHHTRFVQVERFDGLLPRAARGLLERQARHGFEAMNRELAARAEHLEAA